MKNISIWFENGKINVIIDGTFFRDICSLSLSFFRGSPLVFSCVSETGETHRQPDWLESHIPN